MTVRPRDPSSRSSSSETSPSSSTQPFQWNQVDDLTSNGDDQESTSTASTWHEEAHWMSFRLAVQQFASVKLTAATSVIQEEENEDSDVENSSAIATEAFNSQSSKNDVFSDLAETKMRLALAQAERDELEFTLLQRNSPRTTPT